MCQTQLRVTHCFHSCLCEQDAHLLFQACNLNIVCFVHSAPGTASYWKRIIEYFSA